MRYALGWLRSMLFTDVLIYLETAVMGTISLAGSLFDPHGRFQHRCARIWSGMILVTSRVKVRVHGLENIDPRATYIYCANHQSLMDIPVIFSRIPAEFRILAKKGLFSVPFLGWHLRRSGHLEVDRSSPRGALRSFEQAARQLRQGASIFFFPEGGRSDDGTLKPFRPGPFLLAIKVGVPIVPVAVKGTRQVLPMGSMYIRPGAVELMVGKPVATAGLSLRHADRLTAAVHNQIAGFLSGQDHRRDAEVAEKSPTASP
ncbi:MAG: 1-acylglycerol-3-phosphate O-acyltransferase [Acidobacteria bacterium]|nr:1-acylglycerol-3-phosphate O-acyltransferase [Acidobacteriota bacterium]